MNKSEDSEYINHNSGYLNQSFSLFNQKILIRSFSSRIQINPTRHFSQLCSCYYMALPSGAKRLHKDTSGGWTATKVVRIIQGGHARARWAACSPRARVHFSRIFAAGERARTSENDQHVLLGTNCPTPVKLLFHRDVGQFAVKKARNGNRNFLRRWDNLKSLITRVQEYLTRI